MSGALLDDVTDDAGADAAVAATPAGLQETLRDDAGAGKEPADWPLTDRELEVLARPERQTDNPFTPRPESQTTPLLLTQPPTEQVPSGSESGWQYLKRLAVRMPRTSA